MSCLKAVKVWTEGEKALWGKACAWDILAWKGSAEQLRSLEVRELTGGVAFDVGRGWGARGDGKDLDSAQNQPMAQSIDLELSESIHESR